MSVVLACDLGGTSMRASLVDRDGNVLMERDETVPVTTEGIGRSEVDANDWWHALIRLVHEIASGAPHLFDDVRGVAICAITRTQVFLGCDGQQLRPAITWKDTRAQSSLDRLAEQLPDEHPEKIQVNAFHPLARLAWLRDHETSVFENLDTVLEPKDYLNFLLTGVRSTDRISMARLLAAATRGKGCIDLLTAIGTSPRILPAVGGPCDCVGRIVANLPAPLDRLGGVPVFSCSLDTWSAVVGLGGMQADHAYNISGTTEVFGVLSEKIAHAEGLVSVEWQDLNQLGGPGQNGADTVAWFLSTMGLASESAGSIGTALSELLGRQRNEQPLVFLPYLQGERVPFWDPGLRGAFVGLHRNHTATDMAWAVLEGVAFHNRLVLGRAEGALGHAVKEIRVGGGAAANALWRQVKADICERPVVATHEREAGVLGAAAVAWTGLGVFGSLTEAQARLVRVVHRHEPDRRTDAIYRPLFDLFQRSQNALAPVSRELAGLRHPAHMLPGVKR
jgi:xylulokinase